MLGDQQVFAGTRPVDNGWVMAVIRIDDCTSEAEAIWFGERIREDLLIHMSFTNQENVPAEAIDVEQGIPVGGAGWSVAVFVTLGSMMEAQAMLKFMKNYASLNGMER
jgi:hypothetical protein